MGRQVVVFSIQEQFVASIIHRLTQPQTGIKGCLSIGSEEQYHNTYHTLFFKRLIYNETLSKRGGDKQSKHIAQEYSVWHDRVSITMR